MPSPDRNRTRRVRRTINPATAPTEELLAYLATDPSSGLSPKEAERRLAASTAGPLYRVPTRRFADCIKRTVREPVLWLLLSVAVISLFFDRVALGLVCLLLGAGNALLCAFFLWRSDRIQAAFAAYDAPLCRVLRGHRIYRVSASELVRGDILLFYPGDMIPADCRVLRTDGFAVSEREIDGSDPARPSVRLEKDAAAIPETAGNYRLSPPNMVFAGGIAEEGFAIAVAIAVGSETHLGGLSGGLDSPRAGKQPALFRKASRWLSIYNLGLIFLVVPVTAVGIFTLGERYELLDIFLSALAVASVTLTEHLLAKGLHILAAIRRAAATDRDTVNSADIKSSADPERLIGITDLFLVGTVAFHDGESHADTLLMGERLYHCDRPEADSEARIAAEYLYLYRHALLSLPAAGNADSGAVPADTLLSVVDAITDWAEVDTDGFLLRAKEPRRESDGVSAVFPAVEGNRRVTVCVTEDFEAVKSCDKWRTEGGVRPLGEGDVSVLYRAHREAVRTGRRTFFLLTRAGGERSFLAMVAYAPHTCRKTAGNIKSFEAAGIRVCAFLHGHDEVDVHALSECGFSAPRPLLSPAEGEASEAPLSATACLSEGCRALTDCTVSDVLACIRDLQSEGRTVAVLSAEREDISLLNAADVAVTCAPSLYASAEGGHPRLPAYTVSSRNPLASPDGTPDGALASDLCRRRADVIIRRTAFDGGGVGGIRRALLCAEHIKDTLDRVFGFWFLSQTARLLLVVLPVLLGLALPAAPVLLLSGLCMDQLVLLSSIALPHPATPRKRRSMEAGILSPLTTYRNGLIATAAAVAVPVLTAAVCRFCDLDFGGDLAHYLFLCLVGLQTAIYRTDSLPPRDRTVFFTTLALVLVYVGALGIALGAGLGLIWSLVLPLTAPAVYVAVKLILDRIGGQGTDWSTK